MAILILAVCSAFTVSFLLTWYLSQPYAILNILDHPNERSLHSKPIPRTGGVAVLMAILTSICIVIFVGGFENSNRLLLFGFGLLLVAIISFLDDRYSLSVIVRFSIHIASATIIVIGGWVPAILNLPLISVNWPIVVASFFTVLFIVWMINLYNFMDGMDGFAAGMAIFGFGTLGIAGYLNGEILFTLVSSVIAGSAAGFLIFNFPPARIFMGDTGSSILGYLAAVMLLWAEQLQLMPLWLGVLLFSPFILDATVTLVRRSLRGEKFWLPHKTHYYQRLVELGWGHRRTVLAEYILMLILSITVISILNQPNGLIGITALVVWSIIYIIMAIVIQRMERKRVNANGCI